MSLIESMAGQATLGHLQELVGSAQRPSDQRKKLVFEVSVGATLEMLRNGLPVGAVFRVQRKQLLGLGLGPLDLGQGRVQVVIPPGQLTSLDTAFRLWKILVIGVLRRFFPSSAW